MKRVLLVFLILTGCHQNTSPDTATLSSATSISMVETPDHHPSARGSGGEHHVAETNQWPLHDTVKFSVLGIWRYDPDSDHWQRVIKVSIPKLIPSASGAGASSRRILEMPEQIGLYWVSWTEKGKSNGSLVFNGPVLCNDIMIGNPPEGKIAACVPFKDSASAQFVPDPTLYCK